MYCNKCGKETADGAGFCKNCGAAIKMEQTLSVPGQPGKQKRKSKHRFGIVLIIFLLVAIVCAGGVALYVNSAGYQCGQDIKQAEAYFEGGEYEEAVACCKKAIERDATYVDAYLKAAEAYVAMDDYRNAVYILEIGMKKGKDEKEILDRFEDKFDKVYRAQAKCLVGVWTLDYNLADLIPNGIGESIGLDIKIPILLEIGEGGIMRFSVESSFFAGASEKLGAGVSVIVTALAKSPMAGGVAGKVASFVTDLLVEQVGVSFFYEVKEGILYCNMSGDNENIESYSFAIDGNTLYFLEELTPDTENYYLHFPLEMKRFEETPDTEDIM